MIKRAIFIVGILAAAAYADGPLFKNKDTYTQQEFENVYKDIRNIPNGTYRTSSMTVSGIMVDSATVRVRMGIGRAPNVFYPLDVAGSNADAVAISPLNLTAGGNNATVTFTSYTDSVTTSAKTIMSVGWTGLLIVTGDNGSATFTDLVSVFVNGSLGVIQSLTNRGTPASRSYTNCAVGSICLQMGSGTYNVQAFMIALSGR